MTGKQKTQPKPTSLLQMRCCKMHQCICTCFFNIFNDRFNPNTHLDICVSVSTHGNWKALHYNAVPSVCLGSGATIFWIPYMQVGNHSAARDFESFCSERQQESGCVNGAAVLEKTHLCCISSTNKVINIVNESIWNKRVLLMLGKMEECVNHSLKSREMLTTICLGKHNIWIWFRYDALCWAIIKTWVTIRVFPVQHPLVRHS